MKAELRIGNKILLGSTVVDVLEIWDNGLRVTCSNTGCGYTYDQFSPIILTEKWFERFGFEFEEDKQIGGGTLAKSYLLNDFRIIANDLTSYRSLKSFRSPFSKNNIKYVHQLQNLYFCLVGDELELL